MRKYISKYTLKLLQKVEWSSAEEDSLGSQTDLPFKLYLTTHE